MNKNNKNKTNKNENENINSFWKGFGTIFGSIIEGVAEANINREKRELNRRKIEASNNYIKESIDDLMEKIEENKRLGGAFKNTRIYSNKIVLDYTKEDNNSFSYNWNSKSNAEKRLELIQKIEETELKIANLDFDDSNYLKKKWALEESVDEYKKELKNLRK